MTKCGKILYRIKIAFKILRSKKFIVFADEGFGMSGVSISDAVRFSNYFAAIIGTTIEKGDTVRRQDDAIKEVSEILNKK